MLSKLTVFKLFGSHNISLGDALLILNEHLVALLSQKLPLRVLTFLLVLKIILGKPRIACGCFEGV